MTPILAYCARSTPFPSELREGLSQQEVLQILGEPDLQNEFVLPEPPFFGPQESLVNLIPAGSVVLEWQYQSEGENRFVWFWGEDETLQDTWRVVMTLTFPQDAIY